MECLRHSYTIEDTDSHRSYIKLGRFTIFSPRTIFLGAKSTFKWKGPCQPYNWGHANAHKRHAVQAIRAKGVFFCYISPGKLIAESGSLSQLFDLK